MKRGPNMTMTEVIAHQQKHGFIPPDQFQLQPYQRAMLEDITGKKRRDRMNKTESEFARILEAQKQRGEIVEWRFQGIRLAWGADPKTGRVMNYKPDFYVVSYALHGPKDTEEKYWMICGKIIEVKGGHIWDRDKVRFRGCRAEWPMFQFEMWQKRTGHWARLE